MTVKLRARNPVARLIAIALGEAASLAAAPASGADYVSYNWSGFYAGANGGYGWQNPDVAYSPNDPFMAAIFAGSVGIPGQQPLSTSTNFNANGATGGLQAGYSWQFSPVCVASVESDFSFSAIKGDGSVSSFYEAGGQLNLFNRQTITASQDVSWFGTVRARLGWLAASNLLLYGSGGFAYGHVKESVDYSSDFPNGSIHSGGFGAICGAAGSPCLSGASSHLATGWTLGGGGEYALAPNWSIKAEYLYVNLGDGDSFNVVAAKTGLGESPLSFRATYGTVEFQTARIGLNYKFGQ